MCLSKAYLESNGGQELLMEEVASISTRNDKLLLETLFGEQKEIAARIKQIDLLKHSIFLETMD